MKTNLFFERLARRADCSGAHTLSGGAQGTLGFKPIKGNFKSKETIDSDDDDSDLSM